MSLYYIGFQIWGTKGLIKNTLWFKHYDSTKNFLTNKILIFVIIFLFIIPLISNVYPQPKLFYVENNRAIAWDVSLNFNKPCGAYDYSIYGELPNADDVSLAMDNYEPKTLDTVGSFTSITDITPPSVGINQPRSGWIYFSFFGGTIHKKFPIFITTFIFGHITVVATASDSQSGVDRVEFYVDDVLKHIDSTEENGQYTWDWFDYVPLHPYKIKVIAYDKCYNHSEWSLLAWKIL